MIEPVPPPISHAAWAGPSLGFTSFRTSLRSLASFSISDSSKPSNGNSSAGSAARGLETSAQSNANRAPMVIDLMDDLLTRSGDGRKEGHAGVVRPPGNTAGKRVGD